MIETTQKMINTLDCMNKMLLFTDEYERSDLLISLEMLLNVREKNSELYQFAHLQQCEIYFDEKSINYERCEVIQDISFFIETLVNDALDKIFKELKDRID